MTDQRFQFVKIVTSHSASSFEQVLNQLLRCIFNDDGDVFPIQYQFNSGTREHTAVVQYQSKVEVRLDDRAQEALAVDVPRGWNPDYYNPDGTRKDGRGTPTATVVQGPGAGTFSRGDSLLPAADSPEVTGQTDPA